VCHHDPVPNQRLPYPQRSGLKTRAYGVWLVSS